MNWQLFVIAMEISQLSFLMMAGLRGTINERRGERSLHQHYKCTANEKARYRQVPFISFDTAQILSLPCLNSLFTRRTNVSGEMKLGEKEKKRKICIFLRNVHQRVFLRNCQKRVCDSRVSYCLTTANKRYYLHE